MKYNKYDEKDIERYGKMLENTCLRNLGVTHLENSKDKGEMNKVVEAYYFGIKNNNEQEPDFKEAGVELKVSPLKRLKTIPKNPTTLTKAKGLSMKERTVLTMIDYFKLSKENWENNSLEKKAFKILFCFYLYEKQKEKVDFIFDLVNLWSPSQEDIEIIKEDWLKIQKKVLDGKAHEISEGDTLYLGACTKGGKNNEQPFSEFKAKQRAFSFKRSYMETIYEQLLQKRKLDLISIKSKEKTLEETLKDIFKDYMGKTVEELCQIFNINSEAKQLYSMLTNKILKVESYEKIEEFQKAGIIVKSIRVDRKGKPLESISFPNFEIAELLKEDIWEESELYECLEKKFLFIIYSITTENTTKFNNLSQREKQSHLILKDIRLWSISDNDLEKMEDLWNETKKIILEGVQLQITTRGTSNNLPKSDFNGVGHVRPHGKNSEDIDFLPDGRTITKQCFWLNSTFIQNQLYPGIKKKEVEEFIEEYFEIADNINSLEIENNLKNFLPIIECKGYNIASRDYFIKGEKIELRASLPKEYKLYIKIKNTGIEAANKGDLRGNIIEIIPTATSNPNYFNYSHVENIVYKGTHLLEYYIITNNICIYSKSCSVKVAF